MISAFTDDIWSKIEFDLSELRDQFSMRHESKQEAKGQKHSVDGKKADWRDTAPHWEDEEHGRSVRAWLMIPHVDAVDHEAVHERLEAGRRLLSSIERRVAVRELTPKLLHDWGLLNRWAGALQLVYEMKPDARQLRAGNDDLEAHRRWFAHYYLQIQPNRKREEAIEIMEEFINSIVNGLPLGPGLEWFSKFFGPKKSISLEASRRLTKAFGEKLSVTDMEELDALPLDTVPSFALTYPHP
ncbi:hypothetical protein [Rhizobium rhizogenes]|uniref:hypothetical protein n=1 Tax=Rhizobium rhizogenes TaxID=359 RepID=UPI0015717196|nr:hypothetical protein [Rhizobium rhizogenes]NTF69772.1 hypothetical protein [Rhizobium rhizogenes]